MDLLERYLGAIRSQLPDEQKADVTAELRDVLMSQIEEKEEALGRPLSRKELEALLQAFGHPLVVAGRYRKFNQLIGPDVFPFYWFSLRLILTIVAVVQVILAGVLIAMADDPGGVFGQALGRLISSLVATVGWVTVAFVAVEYSGAVKGLQKWRPKHLPAVVFKPRKSRIDAAFELAFTFVFIAWWTGWAPWSHITNSEVVITGGAIREAMHLPVLWLAIAGAGLSAIEVARPSWNRLTVGLSLAWHVAVAALLVIYLRGGPLVEVSGVDPQKVADLSRGLNLGLTIGLSFGTAGMLFGAFQDLRWLWRSRARNEGPAAAAG